MLDFPFRYFLNFIWCELSNLPKCNICGDQQFRTVGTFQRHSLHHLQFIWKNMLLKSSHHVEQQWDTILNNAYTKNNHFDLRTWTLCLNNTRIALGNSIYSQLLGWQFNCQKFMLYKSYFMKQNYYGYNLTSFSLLCPVVRESTNTLVCC